MSASTMISWNVLLHSERTGENQATCRDDDRPVGLSVRATSSLAQGFAVVGANQRAR